MRELLYKTMFVLTIISSFAVLLYTGTGPIQPFTPTVPVFTFNNPFQNVWYNITFLPVTDIINPISSLNCTIGSYWNCINKDGDYNASKNHYVTFDQNGFTEQLNKLYSASGLVANIRFDFWCKADAGYNQGLYFNFTTPDTTSTLFGSYAFYPTCNPLFFQRQTRNFQINTSTGMNSGQFSQSLLHIASFCAFCTPTYVSLSFVSITLTTYSSTGQPPCGLLDVGCAIIQVFSPIILPGLTIINGGIAIVLYIIGWISFILTTIANYISVIIWLYSIPGMPTILQTLVTSVVTLWLAIIGFEIYKAIDPFGD